MLLCVAFSLRPAASISTHTTPTPTQVSLVDDDVSVWRLSVTAFDADTPAGRQLNADLEALGRRHGAAAAAVVLELRFADDYPASPFFLRVVRPRMAMYSGGC